MNFNKKYLLIIPLVIIVIATVKFIKDKLSPMRFSGTVEATQVILSSRISSVLSELVRHSQKGNLSQKNVSISA
nr:hypothetical protein HAGR004_37670 [Bdellovibrio sp. HAGR004]